MGLEYAPVHWGDYQMYSSSMDSSAMDGLGYAYIKDPVLACLGDYSLSEVTSPNEETGRQAVQDPLSTLVGDSLCSLCF